MRRIMKLLAAFGFMVWFLESVGAAVRWWQGGPLSPFDRLLAATLPLIILIWARHFSVFGCSEARCGQTEDSVSGGDATNRS